MSKEHGFFSFGDGFRRDETDTHRDNHHNYWVARAMRDLEGTYDVLMAMRSYPMAAWIVEHVDMFV